MDEDPQVFGLHPNAMITAETSQAKSFMDTVISVQPRVGGGGGGKTPQEIVLDMVREFAKVVPGSLNKRDAHPDTYRQTEEGGMISLGVFHGQETDRFNDLIAKVKLSFAMLDKAIQGLVVMSADYEEMFNAFLIQSTPKMWSKVTYPCLKPLNSWMVDFVDRVAFMRRWLVGGAPASFWVPCFYFPQGFMTAAMQVHARKTRIPIDTLKFWSEPTLIEDGTSDDVQPQENGVNIHGMFLQGCGWNFAGQQMKESDKDILFVLFPVLWLNPVLNSEFAEKMKSSTRYECPLYKTSERKGTLSTTGHSTNWITWFQLPTDMSDQAHWIRRGVALLCMLDD
jgi:dynein heavy chain